MKHFAYTVLLILIASSCISNKRITYLQNLPENEVINLDEFIPYAKVEYKYILQPFDIVDIDFASSNPELTEAFTFQGTRNIRGGMMGAGAGGDLFFFTGYSIDESGFIELPKLGKIQIAGLSEQDAKEKVQQAIDAYFKDDVFVKLRTAGIRYTTIGEFGRSGTNVILRNRATIFDALAASGESNILAKRNKLFIIRQYDGGTKIHQINLHDRALLASPYYFIQPNDILYLEPMRIRQLGNADNLSSSLQLFATFLASGLLIFGLVRGNL
ncbi:polysaccharide biosynthesis/export family protein [Belliella sp. DSM 107340]|uniref:Polysaccharide biosynthesis/export family protein n=1 Tax=Belliella calami TaxID=2923436 RepID=A0ABS9UIP8_9BACT|nr:polysaccharide biosynthesis/export family protein [Belliella calami]MCH7396496.1 polysaccharide biosynthesis/export family protein [Belliella calami]